MWPATPPTTPIATRSRSSSDVRTVTATISRPRPFFAGALDGARRSIAGPPLACTVRAWRAERRGAGDRSLDRLGDVVELQVEEDEPLRVAFVVTRGGEGGRDRAGPRLHEQLEAHLEHADARSPRARADARASSSVGKSSAKTTRESTRGPRFYRQEQSGSPGVQPAGLRAAAAATAAHRLRPPVHRHRRRHRRRPRASAWARRTSCFQLLDRALFFGELRLEGCGVFTGGLRGGELRRRATGASPRRRRSGRGARRRSPWRPPSGPSRS